MTKAIYSQKGESLDYLNNTNETIEANTVIDLSTRIGVAGTEILPGEIGSVHIVGVFKFPKSTAVALSVGDNVYFDGTEITDADTDTPAGFVAYPASASDTNVFVKIG